MTTLIFPQRSLFSRMNLVFSPLDHPELTEGNLGGLRFPVWIGKTPVAPGAICLARKTESVAVGQGWGPRPRGGGGGGPPGEDPPLAGVPRRWERPRGHQLSPGGARSPSAPPRIPGASSARRCHPGAAKGQAPTVAELQAGSQAGPAASGTSRQLGSRPGRTQVLHRGARRSERRGTVPRR